MSKTNKYILKSTKIKYQQIFPVPPEHNGTK